MAPAQPFKLPQDYLPLLRAVFYARFDEVEGSRIVYQVPEGTVSTSDLSRPAISPTNVRLFGERTAPALFEFSSVIDFVLPKKPLCGHLMTTRIDNAKVLGFPCLIEDEEKYDRNFFMFNVCFVFSPEAELAGYEPVVRKTGRVLKSMEQTTSLLSDPKSPLEVRSMLEQLFQDLNSFQETSISFGNDQALDLKLFPFYGNPPSVHDWDVPVPLVNLSRMMRADWDLTICKLLPFVNGTATVRRIADQSNVDLVLCRECVQHLVFFGCCILSDLFQFSNAYALVGGQPLNALGGDPSSPDAIDMQEELEDYVHDPTKSGGMVPSATLLQLYSKLKPGLTVHDWIEQNEMHKLNVDVRRMLSFGVIKGFLRRVFVYPVWLQHPSLKPGRNRTGRSDAGAADLSRQSSASFSKAEATGKAATATEIKPTWPPDLPLMLDGSVHTDALCVKWGVSQSQLDIWLRELGGAKLEVQFICI